MKRSLVILLGCFFLSLPYQTNTVSSPPISSILVAGEELVYEVRWSLFTLGAIRIKNLAPQKSGPAFSAVVYSDSYDIPFVDFHAFSTDSAVVPVKSTKVILGMELKE